MLATTHATHIPKQHAHAPCLHIYADMLTQVRSYRNATRTCTHAHTHTHTRTCTHAGQGIDWGHQRSAGEFYDVLLLYCLLIMDET
jgi:hypothetical protein